MPRQRHSTDSAIPRPEIVCLCGSTRFMTDFHAEEVSLTLLGKIVLTAHVSKDYLEHFYGKGERREAIKSMLDRVHKRKIDLADRVHVLNVGGYIGESTRSEIEYAKKLNKTITYLEPIK